MATTTMGPTSENKTYNDRLNTVKTIVLKWYRLKSMLSTSQWTGRFLETEVTWSSTKKFVHIWKVRLMEEVLLT